MTIAHGSRPAGRDENAQHSTGELQAHLEPLRASGSTVTTRGRDAARRARRDPQPSIVEELDQLAGVNHITRQQLLVQLINASLLNDAPHLPAGPDPIGRLAEHAYLTHRRSLELAAGRSDR